MFLIYSIRQKLRGVPWSLVLTTYLLIFFGLVNLYSATSADVVEARFFVQLKWIGVGTLFLILFGILLDLKSIEQIALPGYVFLCFLLLCVVLFGSHAKGAERWLVLGPIRIQPSEFAKFFLVIMIAKSFSYMRGYYEFYLMTLWRQVLIILLPFGMVLLQPDLGTAGLLLMIGSLQLLTVRLNWRSLFLVSLAGLTVAFVFWNFFLYDYQKQRILNFLNPMLDPRGTGYHSIQSMISVGSGGVFGLGFGQGLQSKLQFLPERHTDFIFSVLAEEHGFIGCLFIFILYILLVLQIFNIAAAARDTFSSVVAMGIAGFFCLHFLINVSMVLGVFPVVGVPLSFLSYGGSNMITSLSCIGILVAIEKKRAAPGKGF